MTIDSLKDLYIFLYNKLVDISNGEVYTIHYLIGPKWQVNDGDDTVEVAKDVLRFCKMLAPKVKNMSKDKIYEYKISTMLDVFKEIANAKKGKWDVFLFDIEYHYYASDTVDIAKKALKKINEYI